MTVIRGEERMVVITTCRGVTDGGSSERRLYRAASGVGEDGHLVGESTSVEGALVDLQKKLLYWDRQP
jgi:hypothetical protein